MTSTERPRFVRPLVSLRLAISLAASSSFPACTFAKLGRVSVAGRDASSAELVQVHVERDGKPLPATASMKLKLGDTISTEGVSTVVLFNKAEATLMPNTKVTLGSIFDWFGEVFISGWLGGKTKLSSASVDGTEYVLRVDPQTDENVVAVLEGKVRVSSQVSAWQPVIVTPGTQVRVARDTATQPPLEPIDRALFNQSLSRSNAARGEGRDPLVPDVRGLSQELSRRELMVGGFEVVVQPRGTQVPAELGQVLEQKPNPGARARRVELHVGSIVDAGGDGKSTVQVASLQLSPPGSAEAGSSLSVVWTGPNRPGDAIAIAPVGAASDAQLDGIPTVSGPTVKLLLPVDEGEYEVRYLSGESKSALETVPYRVTPAAAATLESAVSAPAASDLLVSWTGPSHAWDRVCIVPAGAPDDRFVDELAIVADVAKPATLRAPLEPGAYELRYLLAGKKVLARMGVTITASAARVAGPSSVQAGAPFHFSWSGLRDKRDIVGIVPVGTDDNHYYPDLEVSSDSPSPATLQAPAQPGEYELRYGTRAVSFERHIVLARQRFTVTPATASLRAPASVRAGTELAFSWTGPGRAGDWVQLVPAETSDSRYFGRWRIAAGPAKSGSFRAPALAGTYELRYLLGGAVFGGSPIIARRNVVVTPASATVQGPSRARAGAEVSVTWSGPNHSSDFVALVPIETPDGRYYPGHTASANTKQPARLSTPTAPGGYELRYMLEGEVVIARRKVTLTER
jgi:hypothetical protein